MDKFSFYHYTHPFLYVLIMLRSQTNQPLPQLIQFMI